MVTVRIVISLTVLALCTVVTYGEDCFSSFDCEQVQCEESFTLECVSSQCTCNFHESCQEILDCERAAGNPGDGDLDRDDKGSKRRQEPTCIFGWHCVDNICRCGLGFGLNDDVPGGVPVDQVASIARLDN